MKKLCFIIVIILAAFACKQEPAYKINGTVADPALEGAKVYLLHGGWAVENPQTDSTVIAHGKYEFRGAVPEPECARIVIKHPEDWEKSVHIALAIENVDITITTDAEKWTTVKGAAFNDAYQQYMDAKRKPEQELYKTVNEFYAKQEAGTLTPEEEKQIRKIWNKQLQTVSELEYEFVKRNVNNPAFWNNVFNCAAFATLEQQQALLSAANEQTLQQPVFKKIADLVATLQRTGIGVPYTDIRMNDPDGNEIALSDFVGKGKYILLDFWASWCGPCRREMPNIVKAYNKYKDKGFDIVGIAVDDNREAWVKALSELHMPWHQMSDLKHWDSAGVKAYGIMGIPHTVLIDPHGIIIARGLQGKSLHQKLAEIFKE